MVDTSKKARIVGSFIRQRRESLGLSQRALGQLFEPPVTTQFISNVERGVTPLPPTHVPTLARALMVSEDEVMKLLEKEYAQKLSGRLGKAEENGHASDDNDSQLVIDPNDFEFMRSLYDAYRRADSNSKNAFLTVCESILQIPKGRSGQGDSDPQTPLT